jgi:two-component system, OmpR family, alkaline phosphatase synthesis response regulator PhoP
MGEPADVPGAGQKNKKFIIVVDGNPKDALTTSMILQNFGYSVTTVKSAEEALEFLSIAVPSLVITEFVLPGMNGIVLMDRMRRDPVVSKVPVAVQTSYTDPSGKDRCVEAGCILYLRKPVTGEDLYRAVQSILERIPRKNVRVSTHLKASVEGTGTGEEFVTVISVQGMFVKTLHPRPLGSKHTVSFMLKKKIIWVEAMVLYTYGFSDETAKDPGMGMKFMNIEPEDIALIQTYIQESFSAGAPAK